MPENHRQQIVNLAMPHTDASKSQATNRTSYHASHRHQQITGNKSYILLWLWFQQMTVNKSCFLLCLTQITANHRQQIINLAMPHTDTSKSQATGRTFYHASQRHQQVTGNKSFILRCLTQIPANHKHQIGNKSYFLPCLTQIPANHTQQILHLAMPYTDKIKSQTTKTYILPCLTKIPATNSHDRASYHASHRYPQITGNKAYLQCLHGYQQITGNKCLTQMPTKWAIYIYIYIYIQSCHTSHGYQQITGNKYYILPWLIHIPEIHGQQKGHLAMPHTYTSKSQEKIVHRTMPQIPANHRQQSTLAMPFTETCKSQATNRTSSHCLTQMPATHRQHITHLTMFPTGTRKSQAILPTNRTSCHASRWYQQIQATNRKSSMPQTDSKPGETNRPSYHASHRWKQITGNKSYAPPWLTQTPATHKQQIIHLPCLTRCQQHTGNKSSFIQCLTQIPANHRQQIVPHTDTCIHRQQVVSHR